MVWGIHMIVSRFFPMSDHKIHRRGVHRHFMMVRGTALIQVTAEMLVDDANVTKE